MKADRIAFALLGFIAVLAFAIALTAPGVAQEGLGAAAVRYDEDGNLLLPQGWERWVVVGTSMGLGYSEVETQPDREAFHNVLMEPSSYDHYQRTGEFPEKTMLALAIYSQARRQSIARAGAFAKDLLALEIALKDHERFEEGWAYFNFATQRPRARAFDKSACYSCHVEHGQQDNVFVQFYPRLGPAGGSSEPATEVPQQPQAGAEESPAEPRLALGGNDPVFLVKGEQKPGQEEFEAVEGPFIYRFASGQSLAEFKADPKRFLIQNEMCPVVPTAQASPELFAVHEGKIYIFASSACIDQFKADPSLYLNEES